jgi:hypothetical protein
MHPEDDLPLSERLTHLVEHLAHVLPAQAPIRDFVHHNTLHGFQHLPFAEALEAAHRLTGAAPYLAEARFREFLASGRILPEDLAAALEEAAVAGLDDPIWKALTRRDVLLASLRLPAQAPGAARLAWADAEQGLGGDAFFARCAALTAPAPADVADWRPQAGARSAELFARLGREWTWRSLLEHLTGEDVLERTRTVLQRHLAAHLDLGMAAWRHPLRGQGFFAAWRASAGADLAWELDELPGARDEIAWLPDDAVAVLADELPRLLPDPALWAGYLERLALELPGWSGMFLWRARNPGGGDGTPVAMVDYLAVRVLLERLLGDDLVRRLTGEKIAGNELCAWFAARPAELYVRDALREQALAEDIRHRAAHLAQLGAVPADIAEWEALAAAIAADGRSRAAAHMARAMRLRDLIVALGGGLADSEMLTAASAGDLLAAADSLGPLARGQVWLLAYERRYREQIFSALAANQARRSRPAPPPSAQVVLCMDDREEGTRRHLEEIAPEIQTFGAAGFFGVAMAWQGFDDAGLTALCPIVVQPVHAVREVAAPGATASGERHRERRALRLAWRDRLLHGTRLGLVGGPLLTALAAPPALLALVAGSLAPAWSGAAMARWRTLFEGRPATRLHLTAELPAGLATPAEPQAGFTDDEQADRVERFLRMIGLAADFAPLVLMLGHGSGSRNNPHLSAYDCGACSGRHGGPNARVFAAMANRPAVRERLAARGIAIPEGTWFVGAEHNTCDDSIEWYDLDQVPAPRQGDMDRLVSQLAEACRAHAAERCRRLASAPSRPSPWQGIGHAAGRAADISQARPELGHATNAAAFIGRRDMSRGLFLDRRVFLISYDPSSDPEGAIVEGILLAAGPVGAGISLEYYFSTVDNERFGCGSKVTHNLAGRFGVMEGADSDLRTGLPLQMVEIHEAMRLLVVVEQTTDVLSAIVARQPALQELIGNEWIIVAACDPSTAALHRYCPRRGWLPWSGAAVLPQVGRSADWFAGEREPLPPAIVLGGRP